MIVSKVILPVVFSALLHVQFGKGQAISFCTDGGCDDCPASITTEGTGYPACVVYDTETVFSGYDYPPGTGDVKFFASANIPQPDPGCTVMVRSPAAIAAEGCGDLIAYSNEAACEASLPLQDTFMVQFCCGSGDCTAAGVPWKRSLGGHISRSASAFAGVYLKHANGTTIKPKEVGNPPLPKDGVHVFPEPKEVGVVPGVKKHSHSKRCGWQDGSYVADGDPYIKSGESQIIAASVGPFTTATTISLTYEQSVSTTTSFSASLGDPFGIVSVSVGFDFTNEHSNSVTYSLPVPPNISGQAAFTPYLRCTSGTLINDCDGSTNSGEACTPYLTSGGIVDGDYTFVED